MWNDKSISLQSKIRLLLTIVISVFLYACESWTLDAYLEQRIAAFEMRCLRRLLGIDYRDHVTNVSVREKVTEEIGGHQELLEIVKSRKLKWFGHTTRKNCLAKECLLGTVRGGRGRGRPERSGLTTSKSGQVSASLRQPGLQSAVTTGVGLCGWHRHHRGPYSVA